MPLQPNFIERRLIRRGAIPGILLDGMAGFQIQAVIAAMELGVFEHLRDGPVEVGELAERTDTSRDGMEILLRTLDSIGHVTRDGDAYRLTKGTRRSLPDEDMQLMAVFLKEQLRVGLDAAEAIRDAPAGGLFGWERVQSGELGRAYQETMRWLARDLVDSAVDRIDLPDGTQRMLDVGGSHGLYTVRFCERYPALEGTVLDWEIGLDAARKTLEERPDMADRIELLERDFEREKLPGGYDFAFLGQIVHGLSPMGNRELFEKLAESTTDRGAVALLDQIADPPSSNPLPFDPFDSSLANSVAALLGFTLFLFSGGRSYAYDELERWLTDAGFPQVSYEPLRQSPGYSLVIARKA